MRQCQWSTRVLTSVCRLTVRTSSRRILPALAMSDDDESPAQEPRKPRGRGWMPSLFRFFSQPSERGKRDREYYEKLPIDAKRALYSCGEDYVTMNDIPTWEEFAVGYPCPRNVSRLLPAAVHLSRKVSLWRGDITRLEIDAIVNAANSSLLGGGGVDGAIHQAAGSSLREECAALSGCSTGDAKITSGHKLPAKYILHTVGPMNCSEQRLRSCYSRCLELVLENSIRSVAFCCIATGIYGYPNEEAAHIALETIRRWLETDNNADQMDRVIFCVFLKVDYNIYRDLLHHYFPVETDDRGEEGGRTPPPEETADGESGEREEEGESMPAVPSLDRSVTEPSKSTASSSTPSKQLHQQPSSPTGQQAQQEGNPQPSRPTGQQDQREGVPQPSRPTGQQEGVPQPSSPTGQVDQREEHKEEVKGTKEEAQLLQEAEGTVEQEMVEENEKRE